MFHLAVTMSWCWATQTFCTNALDSTAVRDDEIHCRSVASKLISGGLARKRVWLYMGWRVIL